MFADPALNTKALHSDPSPLCRGQLRWHASVFVWHTHMHVAEINLSATHNAIDQHR